MRNRFFLAMLVMLVVGSVVYFLYSLVVTLYHNWDLTRDVDEIRAASAERRRQRSLENQQRLDNGCEHLFGETLGGFPPNACRRCGLERERPAGPCDHVWRLGKESLPGSYCEKCGQRYKVET